MVETLFDWTDLLTPAPAGLVPELAGSAEEAGPAAAAPPRARTGRAEEPRLVQHALPVLPQLTHTRWLLLMVSK